MHLMALKPHALLLLLLAHKITHAVNELTPA
jgi:hypothetical protein